MSAVVTKFPPAPPPPGREVRVKPHPRGWAVIRAGNVRPSRVAPTKERAIHIAKAYAHEERTELIIEEEDAPRGRRDVGHDD